MGGGWGGSSGPWRGGWGVGGGGSTGKSNANPLEREGEGTNRRRHGRPALPPLTSIHFY